MRYLGFIFIFAFCVKSLQANSYSLSDLRALYTEKNHPEYFQHALDIPPSQRKGEWKKMTEALGLSFLEQLIRKTEISEEEEKLVLKISNWPLFKNDEFFREQRDAYFLKNIRSCFLHKEQNCLEQATMIFTDYPHGLRFSLDLVTVLEQHHPKLETLWKIVEPITISEFGEFYCHKEPINRIIYQKLMVSPSVLSLHPDCRKVLQKPLTSLFYNTPDSELAKNYLLLKKFRWNDKKSDAFHSLLEYLSNKSPELNSLKSIATDYQLREDLLAQLKKRGTLPGSIFNESNLKKRAALTRVLNRHFPEYLPNYARTCVQYLSGEKSFERGNPTPDCHELFKTKQIHHLIPKNLRTEYNRHTYFMHKKRASKERP